MSMKSGSDWALALIRTLPRIALNNLPKAPAPKTRQRGHGQHGGKLHRGPHKGAYQRMSYPRLGWEPDKLPFYARVPFENYYAGHHLKRQYPPLSLGTLQLLIDTNRINIDEPIDLTAICNTKLHEIRPEDRHFGFHLTADGIDTFKAEVNIEVQWTSEPVIAAVEKNGGTITTAYYDLHCLWPAKNPIAWFRSGKPIPKRMIPPEDAIVEPGWVVSLKDKCILKPKDEALLEYYST